MTFNSLFYLFFLPVIYLLFYFTTSRLRWLVLLIASYGFYASFRAPYLPAVLAIITCISYACGLRIAAHQDESCRKRWLWTGISACICIMALLKYLPFLEYETNSIFGLNSTFSHTLITIGVSYYTFQAISYLTDIYLEIDEPEKHFGHYALYLALFPKLLQGPIERAGNLIPQLKRPYLFDYESMRSGMLLFTWGLFKKIVLADRLSLFVNPVFNDVHHYSGIIFIVATYLYALQIYFDFSGYTDMALGTGRLFGFNLTQNFNNPYTATSIADFWRRWHISFSQWILDYIFKPLQMCWRDMKTMGTALALIVTFIVSGVWHGASLCFVVWGLLHGTFLATSTVFKTARKKLYDKIRIGQSNYVKIWQIFVTFNLVCLAWIFFRSNSMSDSMYILTHLVDGFSGIRTLLVSRGLMEFVILAGIVTCFIYSNIKGFDIFIIQKQIITVRWACYNALTCSIIFLSISSGNSFVYFQF